MGPAQEPSQCLRPGELDVRVLLQDRLGQLAQLDLVLVKPGEEPGCGDDVGAGGADGSVGQGLALVATAQPAQHLPGGVPAQHVGDRRREGGQVVLQPGLDAFQLGVERRQHPGRGEQVPHIAGDPVDQQLLERLVGDRQVAGGHPAQDVRASRARHPVQGGLWPRAGEQGLEDGLQLGVDSPAGCAHQLCEPLPDRAGPAQVPPRAVLPSALPAGVPGRVPGAGSARRAALLVVVGKDLELPAAGARLRVAGEPQLAGTTDRLVEDEA